MSTETDTVTLPISGMTCTTCAAGVQKVLEREGATQVDVNFVTGSARFSLADKDKLPSISKKIEGLGFSVGKSGDAHGHTHEKSHGKAPLSPLEKKFLFALFWSAPLLLPMAVHSLHILHDPVVQLFCATPVFLLAVIHFGTSAFNALRARYANMDLLIVGGVVAAYGYSLYGTLAHLGPDYLFYESAATITTIVLFGNLLEERSIRKTTSALSELAALQPQTARQVIRSIDGSERIQEVPLLQLRKGDIISINTGDKVPVDGEIVSGSASVDESMISGESLPKDRRTGETLLGGTLMVGGSVRMRATAVGGETTLSQIIALVEGAQSRKPPIQRTADRVSAIFVPTVAALSFLTFLISLTVGLPLGTSLLRAIAVLVVACPCAMGLATPTAVMVGIGRAASEGILLKGGDILERLATIKHIAFDKTGTLTTGSYSLQKITTNNFSEDEAKVLLSTLASHSSHPVSRALVKGLEGTSPSTLSNVEEMGGLGIKGVLSDGREIALGGVRLLEYFGLSAEHLDANIFLIVSGKVVAAVTLHDDLRLHARSVVEYFQKQGITTSLISGDSRERSQQIADEVGITSVFAEKLPGEKLSLIEEFSKESSTAFVGDGINDAPALARASVGISLGGSTGAALTSAQVILLDGNLQRIQDAHTTAQKTLRIIKENLFWAFSYNIIAIPMAMTGYLTPTVAAFAMTFSDVMVIANSLRLKRKR